MTTEIYPGAMVGSIGTLPLDVVARDGGLKVLRDMLAGDLPAPPMTETLKFTLTEVEEGRVVFAGLPDASHLNPLGTVHGGWTATVMDSALGCAVFSVVKPGEAYTTIEFKVNLVRGLNDRVPLVRAIGRVVHRGRQVTTAEAELVGHDGRLYAHASTTCLLFDLPG